MLQFSSGDTTLCADITIRDDAVLEGDESFTVIMSSTDISTQIQTVSASVVIQNDDSKQKNLVV